MDGYREEHFASSAAAGKPASGFVCIQFFSWMPIASDSPHMTSVAAKPRLLPVDPAALLPCAIGALDRAAVAGFREGFPELDPLI